MRYNSGRIWIQHASVELAGEMTAIIRASFPEFVVGEPQTRDSTTSELIVLRAANSQVNDSKKAKELLGVTLRPVEETVRDCVESAVELGLISLQLLQKL